MHTWLLCHRTWPAPPPCCCPCSPAAQGNTYPQLAPIKYKIILKRQCRKIFDTRFFFLPKIFLFGFWSFWIFQTLISYWFQRHRAVRNSPLYVSSLCVFLGFFLIKHNVPWTMCPLPMCPDDNTMDRSAYSWFFMMHGRSVPYCDAVPRMHRALTAHLFWSFRRVIF